MSLVTPQHQFGTTATTPINANVVSHTLTNLSNLFHQMPDTNTSSPFRHDSPVTSCNSQVVNMGPFPETPKGWHQNGLAVTTWKNKWGEAMLLVPDRPYPLSPGTMAVSLWECFHCGQHTNRPHRVLSRVASQYLRPLAAKRIKLPLISNEQRQN